MYASEAQQIKTIGEQSGITVEPVWADHEIGVQFRNQVYRDYPAAYRAITLESAFQECS